MVKIRIFKMPFYVKVFNKNQKVFIIYLSGNEAALVCGKRKAKFNYIKYWVKWEKKERPVFKEIYVNKSFAEKYKLEIIN